jgi:hypothetical protein
MYSLIYLLLNKPGMGAIYDHSYNDAMVNTVKLTQAQHISNLSNIFCRSVVKA